MLQRIKDSLFTLVFPQACHLCEQSVEESADGIACRRCWEATRVFGGGESLCLKCGRFLGDGPARFETYCRRCDDHLYDAARAVGPYDRALAATVLHLKREPFLGRRPQRLLIRAFRRSGFAAATRIVPVPLSGRRRLERGFNQAAVLADVLARATRLPLDRHSLVRRRHTAVHRAGMDRRAREASVERAFEVRRGNLLRGETILLVDDVFTTGATASACTRALKKKGAGRVFVLTLAGAA